MPDPLFAHGVGLAVVVIVLVKVVVAFTVLLVSTMLMVWFERKVISDMQNRIGPNRAGPFGLLQSLADGTKLFFKEDLLPERADRFVFRLAPLLAVVPAFLVFAVIPVGGIVTIAHHTVELQVADPPMGILFLLAMSSVAVYGTMLAGWSSGSKYPLLGAVRASAQMISYEAALGLTVVTVVLEAHSLSTRSIIASQAHHFWQWNVIRLGFVPFAIFLIASTAEMNRPPFDLAEGESELGGGFNTEYSSLRFALFYLAEFMNTITMSALAVTLFFGGPDGPGFHFLRWLWPILWFLGKTTAFCYVQVWIRASLPRMRYDQLMDLGWKRLIPLALGWLLVVAGVNLSAAWGFAIIGGGVVAAGLLYQSLRVGRRRREAAAQPPAARAVLGAPLRPVARPGGTGG